MGHTRAAALAASQSLRVQDLGAHVEVRRHPGARRMTLRVSRTSRAVIVTLPVHCDLAQAGTFLSSHIDWVRERLGSLPEPVPFAAGVTMPVRGVAHMIEFSGEIRLPAVEVAGVVGEGLVLRINGDRERAPRRLNDWLVGQARGDLDQRVVWHAGRLGVRPRRITVRDQSSRWGSCSTTGLLSFSWRLVLAPPAVLDYVVAHEVAHLAEMNHGPRFWALVRKTCPDMDAARVWLRRHGTELHRYGPSD